ncbi:SAF domain protein [compost metagenome]
MKRFRIILLVISLLCVICVVGYMGYEYYQSSKTDSEVILTQGVKLVAPVNRGQSIEAKHITVVQLEPKDLIEGTIGTLDKVIGTYAITNMKAGEYVLNDRISTTAPHEGLQRIAVNLTPLGAVAGKLKDGDSLTIRAKIPLLEIVEGSKYNVVDIALQAEVFAVVNDQLLDRKGVEQAEYYTSTNNGQLPGPAPVAGAGTTTQVQTTANIFIPEYAIIWVTPEQAAQIIKHDDDGSLRLAING